MLSGVVERVLGHLIEPFFLYDYKRLVPGDDISPQGGVPGSHKGRRILRHLPSKADRVDNIETKVNEK